MKPLTFYNVVFFAPICASILFISADYLIFPKVINSASVQISHVYSHKKGKPCRVSIHIPSKWGNEVFETRTVSKSICKAGYSDISIVHTKYLKRWLYVKGGGDEYYLPDSSILIDALFLFVSVLSVYGFYKNKIKNYFDYSNVVLFGVFIMSIFYFK